MRVLQKASVLGVMLGTIVCTYCWWMEYRSRTAPDGSDAPMAAALVFDVAARPLSYLTSELLYEAGLGSSVIANSLQVLANWWLIAIVGAGVWILALTLMRRRATSAH